MHKVRISVTSSIGQSTNFTYSSSLLIHLSQVVKLNEYYGVSMPPGKHDPSWAEDDGARPPHQRPHAPLLPQLVTLPRRPGPNVGPLQVASYHLQFCLDASLTVPHHVRRQLLLLVPQATTPAGSFCGDEVGRGGAQ